MNVPYYALRKFSDLVSTGYTWTYLEDVADMLERIAISVTRMPNNHFINHIIVFKVERQFLFYKID